MNGKSADLPFPWISQAESQYLFYSIPKDGQQRLWLVSLCLVVLPRLPQWRQIGVLRFFSLEAVLTCNVKCGKTMRPRVVSMTTLLFLIKCKPLIGLVIFFFTTKCSAKMLSPVSNLTLTVANVFSNTSFATCILKLEESSILRLFLEACGFILSYSFWATALT